MSSVADYVFLLLLLLLLLFLFLFLLLFLYSTPLPGRSLLVVLMSGE